MTGRTSPTDGMSGEQIVGLHGSALLSSALLEEGLRRLEEDYGGEGEVSYVILWHLSQGFELLLKLTLWLVDERPRSNHDIPAFLDQLLGLVPAEAMPSSRHEFLSHDKLFRELLEVLGKFGGAGKYSALDAAIGGTKVDAGEQSPIELWEEIKGDLLDDEWFELMQSDPGRLHLRYYPHLYRVVATSLAVGIHSLWWLWVRGPTAERGRLWHPSLTSAASRRVNDLAMRSGP